MKNNIKFALGAIVASAVLFSCSDEYLNRYPDGSTISADQYNKLGLETRLQGTMRGLYSMIYSDSGSDHDEFGQRSIDLWGDILCGDIAVTNKTYGWLYQDEQMRTVTGRTGYIWSFYYSMIRNTNTAIRDISAACNVRDTVAKYGYPSETTTHTYSSDEIEYGLYLAQTFALRAFAYANLVRWYTPVIGSTNMGNYTIMTYPAIPVYDETNMEDPQPLSTADEAYRRVFADIEMSIRFFDEFGAAYLLENGSLYQRETKLGIDGNVARGLAAYAYLNAAPYYTTVNATTASAYYTNAAKYAGEVLASGAFQMISNDKLLTTGFNDVSEPSWMWGQNVTTETAGGLKSWFGQVDIHSYSYAWAGDTKVIDDNLKDEIPLWDARALWFNDGKANSRFKGCPDGKFFSAACPTSTKDDDIDREWLSDNIFMRIESMLLIEAEAYYYLNDYASSIAALTTLTDQRINQLYPFWSDDYDDFKTQITTPQNLLQAIYYNWRVEMWGEGYGLQTFRRLGIEYDERVRGGNHDYNAAGRVRPTDANFNMDIPSSEAIYNPNI